MPPKRAGSQRQTAARGVARKRSDTGDGGKPKRQKKAPAPSGGASGNPKGGPSKDPTGPSSKGKTNGPGNGLDQSLPPISNVDAAFHDIVNRSKGLLIDQSGNLYLRVATMCSGTEAPIWALKMLVEFFERTQPGRRFLKVSHLFSVEIVPFKQAYIARNAPEATLFNDVRDFIEPVNGSAPTAGGAIRAIPTEVDILVAGCSCVDFSALNTKKIQGYAQSDRKLVQEIREEGYDERYSGRLGDVFDKILGGIETLGESGQTFYSMLSYVRNQHPKIVVLENVSMAPWDEATNVWFPFIGYSASHIKLDTKDFYIPHTRNRGYLIALDNNVFEPDAAEVILKEWTKILKNDLTRRASAPVCDWLLPPAHPLTERARQDDSEKALGPAADSEWQRSKSIHTRVRKIEDLGDTRPITMWDVKGGQPYDRMDRGMIRSNPNRVLDCIDIIHLRAEKRGISIGDVFYPYDSRFKCRIHDVSQNIDRSITGPQFGISGCITPSGIHWMPDQCRLLTGFEALKLQGLPLYYLEFATETQDQLRDLAGNAMSTTVVGAVFVALFQAIQTQAGNLNTYFSRPYPEDTDEVERDIWEHDLVDYPNFSTEDTIPIQKAEIIDLFRRSRRYCYCNGSAKYSTGDFLKCAVCDTIRCRWCKGNPPHNFSRVERPPNFLLLPEVEQQVMRYLPSRIAGSRIALPYQVPRIFQLSISSDREILKELLCNTFYYESTHVTEVVIIRYTGLEGFELRAMLSEKGVTWYLYLDSWSKLGKKFRADLDKLEQGLGEKYIQLAQPVAKAEVSGSAGNVLPTEDEWQLWWFGTVELEVDIETPDGTVAITCVCEPPPQLEDHMYRVYGTYRHSPHCDAPSKSLHRHQHNKLYLFKDSPKTTTPDKDCYVISENCRALESHEYREVVMKFPPTVDVAKLESGRHAAFTDGYWDTPQFSIPYAPLIPSHLVDIAEELRVPSTAHFTIGPHNRAQYVLAEAQIRREKAGDIFKLLNKYEFYCRGNADWITVGRTDLHHLQNYISHVNVKLAALEELDVKFEIADINSFLKKLNAWRAEANPDGFADEHLPPIRWIKVGNKHKPYHSFTVMSRFEQMKAFEIPKFELRAKVHSYGENLYDLRVQYLIHHKAFAEKAAAYLPATTDEDAMVTAFVQVQRNAILSQNMQIDAKGADRHKFQPFRNAMKSLQGSSYATPALPAAMGNFKGQLSDLQSRSLSWALSKEVGNPEFTEEEIEEEIIPDLKLRITGRAQRVIHNHGGILADDVGYGKTVVMLALMHCQSERDGESKGAYLSGTLVVVPPHLVGQWKSEARRFIPMMVKEVVVIKNIKDLDDDKSCTLLKRLRSAKIIIVSNEIFSDVQYYKRLARLAGSLDPPFANLEKTPEVSGRAFEDWYKDAVPAARDHLESLLELRDNQATGSGAVLWRKIEDRRLKMETNYQDWINDFSSWTGVGGSIVAKPKISEMFECPEDMFQGEKAGFAHILELFTYPRVIFDEFSYENYPAGLFFATLKAHAKWILSATPPTRNLAAVEAIGKLINVHIARPIYSRQGLPTITEGPPLREPSSAEVLQHRKLLSDECIRERHDKGVEFLGAFATSNPLDDDLAGSIKVVEKVVVSEMCKTEFIFYKDIELDLRACGMNVYHMPKDSRTLINQLIDEDQWDENGRQAAMVILLTLSSWGLWGRGDWETSLKDLLEHRAFQAESAQVIFQVYAEKAIWLSMRVYRNPEEMGYENAMAAINDICLILKDICKFDLGSCGGLDCWWSMCEAIIAGGPGKGAVRFHQKLLRLETEAPTFKSHGRDNDESFLRFLSSETLTSWHDYFALRLDDVERMKNSEAQQLVKDLARLHSDFVDSHKQSTAKETLMEIVKDVSGLAGCKKQMRSHNVPLPTLKYEFTYGYFAKARLMKFCRSLGILYDPQDTKSTLISLLEAHDHDQLGEENYATFNNFRVMKPGRYPTYEKTVRVRGGMYTYTRSDTSDTSIQLRGAQEQLTYALKQKRIVKNLMSEGTHLSCDGCGLLRSKEELYFVCECGHLLCAGHLNSKQCCGNAHDIDFADCCPALLENSIINLRDVNKPQRRLGLKSGAEHEAPSKKISSKSQMIANTIRSTPDDEYVLLFVQFEKQIEELKYTLERNGIGYTTDTESDQGFTPMGDLENMGINTLVKLCRERGCIPEDKDHDIRTECGERVLRQRIKDFERKHGRVQCPKVRILKLNDPTSAGTNLQYANHVMFASPLLTNLQEEYDAYMKQAKGRCVRFGQRKTVQVYHFVTANTVEVDILELRRQSHILVCPGEAIGRLQPVPLAHFNRTTGGNQSSTADDSGDVIMDHEAELAAARAGKAVDRGEKRVNSCLTAAEIWKAMNEANWLNTVGMEY
ncbi:hypothetical protein F4776DRAFT_675687 [Hypoxylon sp. NC0597]|nr:hypothetical protein F4776DRAFT_675687 [Hypoxylon sp. NC0597]